MELTPTVSPDEAQATQLRTIAAKVRQGKYHGIPRMLRPSGGEALKAYAELRFDILSVRDDKKRDIYLSLLDAAPQLTSPAPAAETSLADTDIVPAADHDVEMGESGSERVATVFSTNAGKGKKSASHSVVKEQEGNESGYEADVDRLRFPYRQRAHKPTVVELMPLPHPEAWWVDDAKQTDPASGSRIIQVQQSNTEDRMVQASSGAATREASSSAGAQPQRRDSVDQPRDQMSAQEDTRMRDAGDSSSTGEL